MRRRYWAATMASLVILGATGAGMYAHSRMISDTLGREMDTISLVGTTMTDTSRMDLQTADNQPGMVEIYAGDSKVTRQVVNNVSSLIERVTSNVFQQDLGAIPKNSAHIVLLSSAAGYAKVAAAVFGQKEAGLVLKQTGGFTNQSTVYIPLYKYQDNAFLANTLTHELTHATLNHDGIGGALPTWVNEGFAWYNGIQAENHINASLTKSMSSALLKQIQTAKENGTFAPLSDKPSSVLVVHPTYNVEFQDYLAVNALIQRYGRQKFDEFLMQIPRIGTDLSFQSTYHSSLSSFLNTVNNRV